MPLASGYSQATFSANVAEMIRAGHSRESAIWAAASSARKSYFHAHPHGALPYWLAYPKTARLRNHYDANGQPLVHGNPAPVDPREMTAAQINKALDKIDAQGSKLNDALIDAGRGHERPNTYRRGSGDPLTELYLDLYDARMALVNEIARRYGPNAPHRLPLKFRNIRRNPRGNADIVQATQLYAGFTGTQPRTVRKLPMPAPPRAALAIGRVFGILYEVDATGERLHHEFKGKARPLLVVSADGHQVYLRGGAFTFTKRGFVDKAR